MGLIKTGLVKICASCGKSFILFYDPETKKILTGAYFGKIKLKYFTGWIYRIIDFKTFETVPVFRNKIYKLLYYSYIGRLYYHIWNLFNSESIGYYECEECQKKCQQEN